MMITGKTLFAVVDSDEPFEPSLINGVKQAGAILSTMASQPFDLLFLFYMPTTRVNAQETSREVRRRHPECKTMLLELPESDPERPMLVISQLLRRVRHLLRTSRNSDNHVSLSSGSPEMRAALLFLVTASVLPASLLRVGSSAERLLGPPSVKEFRLGALGASIEPGGANCLEGLIESIDMNSFSVSEDRYQQVEPVLKEIPIYIFADSMKLVVETAARVAPTETSVLILGPSGTGKEPFARLIHRLSSRSGKPLRSVNCAGLSPTLIESELFGHVKGAFTDAKTDRTGIFESADKGTLFLDEIGDLPYSLQAKLLRAVEQGEIQPLGSSEIRRVDVRIIAATSVDLPTAMKERRFRKDLYYRLSGAKVLLPPLEARREEITYLALKLLERRNQAGGVPTTFSKESIRCLNEHSWPGNVRELKNVVENAINYAIADGSDVIKPEHIVIDTAPIGEPSLDCLPFPPPGLDLKKIQREVHAHYVYKALSVSRGNQSEAARLLGIKKQSVSEFLAKKDDRPA